jgi:hypothetical protein
MGGAQSGAAAVSVDVPWFMFHYVDVTINAVRYFVNYFYSLLLFYGGQGGEDRRVTRGRNRVAVETVAHRTPKVARASQPWAGRQNPVGI